MRMGNPDAPVKLVEYGSRTCPLCARFNAEGVPILVAGYVASGKTSYEFRDFPVHGALDLAPILLGRCVSPRQFFPVLDRMFRQQVPLLAKVQDIAGSMPPDADANTIALTYAKGLGYLDLMLRAGFVQAKLTACLADRRAVYRIAAEAKTAQIEGTPAFIINGQIIANVFNWADLQPILSGAMK
jgi:protein-disulfide isomerase